jgi:hypothetical protein
MPPLFCFTTLDPFFLPFLRVITVPAHLFCAAPFNYENAHPNDDRQQ